MTVAAISLTGASSTSAKWDSINWKNTEAEVYRLQMRIAKAVSEGRHALCASDSETKIR
jgi:RNA-directed DNA polymerase